jgi:hypothetical protein
MFWKHLAALAALIAISAPAAAFDTPFTQQSPGITFYLSIPLDARDVKENKLAAGLQLQGQRAYETVRVDTRMFDDKSTLNFFGTGIELKWIIAGVVAAGAVAVVATKDKSTTNNQQQQQQAQAQQQQQQGGGGQQHPGHFEGDGCACHDLSVR